MELELINGFITKYHFEVRDYNYFTLKLKNMYFTSKIIGPRLNLIKLAKYKLFFAIIGSFLKQYTKVATFFNSRTVHNAQQLYVILYDNIQSVCFINNQELNIQINLH